jgi:hypothetical protein
MSKLRKVLQANAIRAREAVDNKLVTFEVAQNGEVTGLVLRTSKDTFGFEALAATLAKTEVASHYKVNLTKKTCSCKQRSTCFCPHLFAVAMASGTDVAVNSRRLDVNGVRH